jgi:hypothetical protein
MFINLNRFKTSSVAKAISSLFLDFTATNTLDDRVTFSRTSNATVTRADGTIGYAPHNLLTFSEQFDNAAWTKSNATVTANSTTAPDGTLTADSLLETVDNTTHALSRGILPQNVVSSCSLFVKANGRNFVMLGNSEHAISVNLTTGVASSATGSPFNITSANAGDGWWRISFSATYTTTTLLVIYSSTDGVFANRIYVGDITKGIYLWGAQLEIGSTATTYNPTTVKNLLGFTESFDNAAWTKSNSFVQSNLWTYSESFDNAAWPKTGASISTNTTRAPNGYDTADTFIVDTSTGTHRLERSLSLTSGVSYTYSVYAKQKEYTNITIRALANDVLTGAIFDLSGVAVTSTGSSLTSATIESVGNGWCRCAITWVSNTTGSVGTRIQLVDNSGQTSFTGDGTSGVFIWGAQLVQGSVAGDYRRTDASALPVFYPNHNGVVCAQKLVENTASNIHNTDVASDITIISGTPYTGSIYVKAGERSKVIVGMRLGTSLFTGIVVDLNLGTFVTNWNTAPTAYKIEAQGNGWFRVSVTNNANTTGSVGDIRVYTINELNEQSYTGDGTSGIYVFGAQLSDSASLDPYVLNAGTAPTAQAYYGPRFDYDPVTLQPKGLLIEEQRSNLLTFSEQFDNAVWNATAAITANSVISPSGLQNADTLTADAVYQPVTCTANTTYTFSFYAKLGTMLANKYLFALRNDTAGVFIAQDISPSITLNSTEWQRVTYTFTTPVGCTTVRPYIYRDSAGGANGTVYIWGAQLEAGAFATSYIPTVASQVTRTADNASIQGSNFYSWYNQNEGSVYCNAVSNGLSSLGSSTFWSINDNTINNRMRFNPAGFAFDVLANGTTQASVSNPYTLGTLAKVASAYKTNSFNSAINNTLGIEDTSGIIPIVTQMQLGNLLTLRELNGTIKSLSYYDIRLSNDVLRGLTA